MVVKVALSLSLSFSHQQNETSHHPHTSKRQPSWERNGKREHGHHSFLNPPIKQARIEFLFH